MSIVTAILLALAVILCGAAAFSYTQVQGVHTFPAGVALYLLSLFLARIH